jgi:hypothetical protein
MGATPCIFAQIWRGLYEGSLETKRGNFIFIYKVRYSPVKYESTYVYWL